MNERYAQRAVTRYESTSQAQQWPRPARPKPDDEGTEMRTFVKASIALTAMLASTLLAVSDDVPVLNIVPVCRGIASQAANPTEKGGPDLDFKNCTSSEQEVRVQLAKVWSTFQPADKGHCIRLAQSRWGVELHGTDNLPRDGTGREKSAFD
jgi:hypothetical protein